MEETDQTSDLNKILEALVPPDNIIIQDVFGDKHKLPSSVGARKQIRIARVLEFIKDYDVDENIDMTDGANIVGIIMSVVQDEKVLEALKTCFEIAHPTVTHRILEKAKEEQEEHQDILDLLPIEEVVTAIVPLFIKATKKGLVALQILSKTTQSEI